MKRLVLVLVMLLSFTATLRPIMAQESGTITLEPFTDTQYGFTGVKPQGWDTVSPGIVRRKAGEPTLLAQQAAPLSADGIMKALLPQFGLTETPESTGTYGTDALEWTLYSFANTFAGQEISFALALANEEGKTYLVLLQTTPDEFDALYDDLFIPAVDALAPYVEEPSEALPYDEEEVTFENGDITLSGTLSLPRTDGPHPAVVLVSGSGAQDRDEALGFPLKPFKIIADYLTRQGIAVLRYDDRGVGKSTGDFAAATSEDFATDAVAALEFLQTRDDITSDEIGMLGHSEGGLIASILGSQDQDFAFYISLAGTAVKGDEVLLLQNELILRANGASEEDIKTQVEVLKQAIALAIKGDREAFEAFVIETVKAEVAKMPEAERNKLGDVDKYAEDQAKLQADTLVTPWFRYFLQYDAGAGWAKTTTPVLAIFGGLDLQVPDEQNAAPFEAAMKAAGNEDYEVVIFPKANHLMQEATTGSPNEYGTLKQEFMPEVMPAIAEWILARVTIAK